MANSVKQYKIMEIVDKQKNKFLSKPTWQKHLSKVEFHHGHFENDAEYQMQTFKHAAVALMKKKNMLFYLNQLYYQYSKV